MFRSLEDWGLKERARAHAAGAVLFLLLALCLCLAAFGVAVRSAHAGTPVASHPTAPPAPPSLWIEQLGPDGEVTARRDVARLVFNDGTTMDCAALFTTPPARPLGSDVQTIGFEIPSSSLRIVFDVYRP